MKNPIDTLTVAPSGGFISAVWQRDCKVRKGIVSRVEKRVAAHSLTFGVAYDNRAVVQSGRENGTLPAENAGLKGFEWIEYPRFLRAVKSGKLYARLNVTKKTRFASTYWLDGKRVTKASVEPMLLASEISSGEVPTVINVGLDNFRAVRA
jgi:hypothetical protein